jgi:aspartate-semialdehyde dehydrogenase
MVMAIGPLHKIFKKKTSCFNISSCYCSGYKAVEQLKSERANISGTKFILKNRFERNPHCDVFLENGYTKEEMKLVNETRKILNDKH